MITPHQALPRTPARLWGRALLLVLSLALLAAAALPAQAAGLVVYVRDPAGAPLTDVVVYAQSKSAPSALPRTPKTAAIEQKDREFVPYVSVIQTGTTVNFPNRDPLFHHVYSFSPAKSFEIKLYSGAAPSGILFDKPGVVTLGCNIHDWMVGYIQVVDTPYFGKTGSEGQVQIDLPTGEYEVTIWHPNQRAAAAPKTLRLDGNSAQEFVLDVTPRKKVYKPPLDAIRYK